MKTFLPPKSSWSGLSSRPRRHSCRRFSCSVARRGVCPLVSVCVWATAAIAAAASAGPYQSIGFLETPAAVHLGAFSGVTIDTSGRIYVLQRGDPPLLAFDRNGRYIRAWGQ